jgi:Rrf2 family iron-sulfur cluster assembly transcriptional regulator
MRLTTRGRYAVTAILDLALHEGGMVSLADIATRQGISLAYLQQLFSLLQRRGLVESVRGPGGGYRLKGDPQGISVADVIEAVDEGMDSTRCGGQRNCHGEHPCLTHDLWTGLTDHIVTYLGEITLADLRTRASVQETIRWQEDAHRRGTNAAGAT